MGLREIEGDILDGAFEGCSQLKSIDLPKSVVKIGRGTFSFCSSLESIIIPDGITELCEDEFFECSGLKSIVIPNTVKRIERGAFHGCAALEQIEIPDSVVSIKEFAFSGCTRLKTVRLPNNIITLGFEAFRECNELSTLYLSDWTVNSIWSWSRAINVSLVKSIILNTMQTEPSRIRTVVFRLYAIFMNARITLKVPVGRGYIYRHYPPFIGKISEVQAILRTSNRNFLGE